MPEPGEVGEVGVFVFGGVGDDDRVKIVFFEKFFKLFFHRKK